MASKTRHRLRAVTRLVLLLVGPLSLPLLLAPPSARAQDAGDARGLDDFSGFVSVTNKGISTIPNLTLGRPAAVFSMVAEKNGVSFAPEFRVSLEGQPWAFLFRWRYDLVQNGRFRLNVGAGPSVSFKPFYVTEENAGREVNEARRFLASELSASYRLAQGVSVGAYHLYSYGFEASVPDHTNYLSAGVGLPGIGLTGGLSLSFLPQLYYLNLDGSDGVYATLNTTLSKEDLPLTITSIVNTPLQTSITGSPGFLWNVSMVYTFDLVN